MLGALAINKGLAPVGSLHPQSPEFSLAVGNAGRSAAMGPGVDLLGIAPHQPSARTSMGHTLSPPTPS